MQNDDWSANCVALPVESRVNGLYETTHLADAYAIRLPSDAITVTSIGGAVQPAQGGADRVACLGRVRTLY